MLRIGILFGGQSREREIAFAGGRTVYDNLDKNLFEAVPIFIDSVGNFILLDWQFVYKGTIRDFYPPFAYIPPSENNFQIYAESVLGKTPKLTDEFIQAVGKPLPPDEWRNHFDIAFLALHGPYGEDGNIQGMLEWYGIPYTGCGILPSAIGISKAVQQQWLLQTGFNRPKQVSMTKSEWLRCNKDQVLEKWATELEFPFVVKASSQGSSIGVAVIKNNNIITFENAVNGAFFLQKIRKEDWLKYSNTQKIDLIRQMTDIREGIGLPVREWGTDYIIYHPEELLQYLDFSSYQRHHLFDEELLLESIDSEEIVLAESFIKGKEFSCIVIQDPNGKPIALPPTEIVKATDVFDYRSKYLAGISRKITPIDLPTEQIQAIRKECERLFQVIHAQVYARIDGFITEEGTIYLNDPNTTSGMLPSSFFFHQAAEIGLNPSQFLTYIIETSLAERLKTGKRNHAIRSLQDKLKEELILQQIKTDERKRIGVIMGGYSSERHISVESGRNIYEKLASSGKYEPVPIFLTGSDSKHELYLLPIHVMLKDNADDIKAKVKNGRKTHEIIAQIRQECEPITKKYTSQPPLFESKKISYEDLAKQVDFAFIALHGRPGEDGSLQQELNKVGIPFNGSEAKSSAITINKYETNKILMQNGISVASHYLVTKEDWKADKSTVIIKIEKRLNYPLICKPTDDGCSSAVKKIRNRKELEAFATQIFRRTNDLLPEPAEILRLTAKEEFPQKNTFLVEELISKGNAIHFLEITGGLLTHYDENGNIVYEIFEPSETLASGDVLSLEEKFLAGEGQNITPARFAKDASEQARISAEVRKTLEQTARLLQVEGYARIDAFVRIYADGKVETIIIEINSLPGMTPATCIYHQAAINQYKPYDFIEKIIEFGMKRKALNMT
jgi:D-alanine-D-alanine ligase